MNSVCTHIVGIHRQKIKKVEGTTSKLYDLILQEEELQAREIANAEKKREQIEVFINRFRAQANRAAAVQSRVKALQKHEMPEKLSNLQNLEFSFSEAAFPGKRMLLVQNLSFGYGDGPDLFSGIEFAVYPGDRIGVIGPNGKGKTTFLNVIGGELQARTGTMNANPNTVQGYFGQTNVQRLHLENTIEGEILSVLPEPLISRARGLAGLMMFEGDAALKPIKVLSGGERARVLLAKILAQPCNLLLLDEPTNHLDMESIDSLVEAVDVFSGAVMVVSHSEQILHALCTRLIVFDGGECTVFDGTYEDFLERKGWSNEGTKKKNTKLAKLTGAKNQKQATAKADIASNNHAEQGDITKENNKEDRRLRAEKVAQKNKVLKPLKQAAQDLERKIEVLETKLQQAQDELLQASEQGNAEGIQKSSEQIGRIEKERDTVYELYENALLQLEQAQAEWE
jgi:ATP-binding cassette, subfamily F, member 3